MRLKNCAAGFLAELFSLLMLSLMCSSLHAQSFFGSIVGTVTDASGGAIPAATVTVTNISTNEKHTVKSGGAGEYRLVDLVPTLIG